MYLYSSYDIETFIYEGKSNKYNRDNIDILARIGDNMISVGTIYDKYYNFIMELVAPVKLTDKEIIEYKYNPKKLSYTLYKSEELWHLLLIINNIASEIDFKPQSGDIINILDPSKINVLNNISLLESKAIMRDRKALSRNGK